MVGPAWLVYGSHGDLMTIPLTARERYALGQQQRKHMRRAEQQRGTRKTGHDIAHPE